MKFDGTCIVCKEKNQINGDGLLAKGFGRKHGKCGETNETQGKKSGGPACWQKM